MKSIVSICLLISVIAFGSCRKYSIRGEGSTTIETRDLSYINTIQSSDNVDVDIIPSNTNKVVVSGYENLVSEFETCESNGTLRLRFRDGFFNISNNNIRVKVYVTSLHEVSISGSGNINMLSNINSDDMSIQISGSGDVTVNENYFNVMHCKISGSGNIYARDCVANDVYAKISGSGDIEVTANDFLDATISGSGNINYWGNPETVNVSVSGSGKVRKK